MNDPRALPEIARDPIWQFFGVLITLILGVMTLAHSWLSRQRKALSFETLSLTPLVTIHDDVDGRVQVMLDGEPVQDVQLALIKIINSGNVPIEASDYEHPVTFIVNEGAQILSVGMTEAFPKTIKTSINHNETSVIIAPLLLNGGDFIKFKILAANFNGKISADARIKGVTDIKELKFTYIRLNRFIQVACGLVLILFLLIYLLLIYLGFKLAKTYFILVELSLCVFIILATFTRILPSVMRKIIRI